MEQKNIIGFEKEYESKEHPSIKGLQIIEGKNNFPISWLNKQGYCEYQLYLEHMKGIETQPTAAMTQGSKIHEELEDIFKQDSTPSTFEEAVEASKETASMSRECFVVAPDYGIRGYIDEIWMKPDEIVIIDDKPGRTPYESTMNQVRAYCLAYKDMTNEDRKIKAAYVAIKPIMDKLHERFIELSLTSNEAKEIDFSQYLEAYRKKEAEKLEKGLREQIGSTYHVAGKYFSEEISRALGKEFKMKKEKPFDCLTDSKMFHYLSANVKELAEQNGIEEQTLTEHIKRFKGFWGYLDGYNANRENYYTTDKEQSTAVATRIVHENLPTFCDNILRFEKWREELQTFKIWILFKTYNRCVVMTNNIQSHTKT